MKMQVSIQIPSEAETPRELGHGAVAAVRVGDRVLLIGAALGGEVDEVGREGVWTRVEWARPEVVVVYRKVCDSEEFRQAMVECAYERIVEHLEDLPYDYVDPRLSG
ncbi:MAG: hypothetical protein VX899_10100 [Myxococcota bacterium]|nr:hypothetical protein [Myxococcota bacterium]